jgi:hypothetical protein
VRRTIEDLKPADYNPRTMSDRARAGLSNSIDSFGLVQPIIWNKRTGRVVGGHQRLYDLIAKGATDTDVVEVDIPEIKEKALNIALNHSGISGDFEQGKLQQLLQEIGNQAPQLMEDTNLVDLLRVDTDIPDFKEYDEHIADGESVCICETCGHQHSKNMQKKRDSKATRGKPGSIFSKEDAAAPSDFQAVE